MTGAGIFVLVLLVALAMNNSNLLGRSPSGTKTIYAHSIPIEVEVVSSAADRERGLSGRASLKPGHGMLFVFDAEGEWGIWMKDMNFPIDIIWANSDGRIVSVVSNASPDSYPTVFKPAVAARYVLEVPAGYAAQNNILEGERLKL